MKICYKCKETKSLDQFHKSKSKKDGHATCCKECRKIIHKRHYEQNKQRYIDQEQQRRQKLQDEVWELKRKPCTDCGQSFQPWQMDFDHISDDKETNIGVLIGRGNRAKLYDEIAKCELVCANCHRNRTYLRGCRQAV